MITELTREQEEKIPEYVKKGLEIGLETQPEGITDKQSVIESVKKLYKAYDYPEPVVYFADSPLSGRIMTDLIIKKDSTDLTQKELDKLTAEVSRSDVDFKYDYMAGSQELYWLYFYKFINDELPVNKFNGPLNETIELCEKIGWFFPYDKFVVVTPKPAKLCMVDERLHNTDGPAIEFLDGYKVYAMGGVRFNKGMERFITTPVDQLDSKEVLNITNVEQRAEVIKRIGIDKLFFDLNPKLLDTSSGYELYSVPLYEDMPRIYLKMLNPSVPGEIHIEAVHPECSSVDEALNWRNMGTVKLPETGFISPVVLT